MLSQVSKVELRHLNIWQKSLGAGFAPNIECKIIKFFRKRSKNRKKVVSVENYPELRALEVLLRSQPIQFETLSCSSRLRQSCMCTELAHSSLPMPNYRASAHSDLPSVRTISLRLRPSHSESNSRSFANRPASQPIRRTR